MRAIKLTRAEADAVHWATGNFTIANANDIKEMMGNGMTRNQAKALVRAHRKIADLLGYKH